MLAVSWPLLALPLGAALDAALGDPRGWPHPVRAIGGLIAVLERGMRTIVARTGGGAWAEHIAGIALAGLVIAPTALAAWGVLLACDRLGGAASLAGRALLIYWGLAARSLGREVRLAADAPDLETARRELGMVVGRDTAGLDQPEIHRACVETVAENCNDAVVAPLFWFAVAGPVGLWVFKAINTLDSMVGYRDSRYRHLGFASARLDDLAALLPARLTWLLIALASLLCGEGALAALRIGWRDGRKHPSPNAAWGEAAMAGALGVQLGGPTCYGGDTHLKPLLGEPDGPIDSATVARAVRLMHVAALLAVGLAWAVRAGLMGAA